MDRHLDSKYPGQSLWQSLQTFINTCQRLRIYSIIPVFSLCHLRLSAMSPLDLTFPRAFAWPQTMEWPLGPGNLRTNCRCGMSFRIKFAIHKAANSNAVVQMLETVIIFRKWFLIVCRIKGIGLTDS